ncbi:universal stress protein (plasmid) [Halorussus salilacus]|uniref:universal stress protein n=1 Tax=Halorussus salilacus TaxID=2953750 RepID=UPI00209EC80C|nr:universal stress protein [Halorussus salilacus]USZ69808.1 universal stress protein [Halorussus salilacus]
MYERILVPTDGSELATRAFEHALDLAATYDSELHVVYAVNVTAGADVDTAMIQQELEKAGERATETLAERARDAGVEAVTVETVYGPPHRAILKYADENDVDLVVMGTQGRTGLNRYLLGSVTEKVVRLSDAPVLTVRGDDEDAE